MTRTAQQNAEEFGRHERSGGWALALLVACSVKPGTANGRPTKSASTDAVSGKISAREFARQSKTSDARVRRYFDAWQKAAAAGICSYAEVLSPSDAADPRYSPLEADYAFDRYFDASDSGGRPRDSKPEHAAAIIEKRGADAVIAAMPAETKRELEQALLRDPKRPEETERRLANATDEIRERTFNRQVAEAVGVDAASDHLHSAAQQLLLAEAYRQRFGITSPKAEADALAEVDHARSLYGNDRRFNKTDREFLEEMGVEV